MSAGELVALHSAVTGRAPVRFVPAHATGGLPAGAETFAPYFDVRCRFADRRARMLLEREGVDKPDPRDYLERLVVYARRAAWGKRSLSRQGSFSLTGA